MKQILILSMTKPEILATAPIQTMKRREKKCRKEEVHKFVNDSISKHVTREMFDSTLNSVIDSHSVNLVSVSKRECLLLVKESCHVSSD